MQVAARQRGLTMIGWMVVIAIAAFFITVFLKLVPVYLEHFSVASSLDSVAAEGQARTASEIRETLRKRFSINNITRVDGKDVKIERESDRYRVRIAYEVRVPFVANIDFVVSFDDQAEVPAS